MAHPLRSAAGTGQGWSIGSKWGLVVRPGRWPERRYRI